MHTHIYEYSLNAYINMVSILIDCIYTHRYQYIHIHTHTHIGKGLEGHQIEYYRGTVIRSKDKTIGLEQ